MPHRKQEHQRYYVIMSWFPDILRTEVKRGRGSFGEKKRRQIGPPLELFSVKPLFLPIFVFILPSCNLIKLPLNTDMFYRLCLGFASSARFGRVLW